MNIVILGQGAIGLLWYRALHQVKAGIANKTAVIDNALTVSIRSTSPPLQVKANFTFTGIGGLSEQRQLVYADKARLADCDYLLVCVKSYQVKQALEQVLPKLPPSTAIILCHNGMGTLTELSPLLNTQTTSQTSSKHPILVMLTTHGCLRTTAKHIRHTGLGYSDLGLVSGQLSQSQISPLIALCNQALPEVIWTDMIIARQWRKLAINCVINPLTALHQFKNGQILADNFSNKITLILQEICQIAACEGITLDHQELIKIVKAVALATKENNSSMYCDLLAGKKTEIDYINGYIHRLGQQHHVSTPENSRLWQQVSALERT